jgi:ABC-type sugar transport system ATPase subunit
VAVSDVARAPDEAPALEVRSLSRSFGPVQALSEVSLELFPGEVLGLLGDNGAGKTTLVRCLSGVLSPDEGSILVDGQEVRLDTPQRARDLGVEVVHQDLELVRTMDVASNLFLNRELRSRQAPLKWLRWLDKRRMYRESEAILDRLRIRVPSVRDSIEHLSGGQRQAVAVGRAVGWGRHIVLMDEPAAALGVQQAQHVLEIIRSLGESGVGVLLVSHNMQHVVEVCDRAVVLRHGRMAGSVRIPDVTPRDLVDLITGAASGVSEGPEGGRR